MIRDTQLDSWQITKKTIGRRQSEVLEVIRVRRGAAGYEIAQVLHRPLHAISGRLTELANLGHITDNGRRAFNGLTRRKVIVWEEVAENGYPIQ